MDNIIDNTIASYTHEPFCILDYLEILIRIQTVFGDHIRENPAVVAEWISEYANRLQE